MKKIGIILIIGGLIIMSIPFIGDTYMQAKRNEMYTEYLQQLEQKEADSNFVSEKIVQKASDKNEEKEEEEVSYSFKEDEVMGKIKVPSIGVDLLVIEGESKENLKLGATHMLGTAYPGEVGNCVIAGHRNYTFGSMFNRLGEVKLNDQIHLEIGEYEYIYEVDEIEVINPDNLDVLKQPMNEKRLTLLTCHPIHVGNKRLLIKAKLIEKEDK